MKVIYRGCRADRAMWQGTAVRGAWCGEVAQCALVRFRCSGRGAGEARCGCGRARILGWASRGGLLRPLRIKSGLVAALGSDLQTRHLFLMWW